MIVIIFMISILLIITSPGLFRILFGVGFIRFGILLLSYLLSK